MRNSLHIGFENISREMVLVLLFFIATPVVIFSSLFSLLNLSNNNEVKQFNNGSFKIVSGRPLSSQVFSALPSYDYSVSGEASPEDGRTAIIRQYLDYYQSPLAPYSHYLILISDKYGLDYRLLTAIAQQESSLCKSIPTDSYNCWGWGIHSKGTLGFASFDEAIETVARGLKEEYLDKGYTNPEEIMAKYTPLSQGSWALGVSNFMEEMEEGVK